MVTHSPCRLPAAESAISSVSRGTLTNAPPREPSAIGIFRQREQINNDIHPHNDVRPNGGLTAKRSLWSCRGLGEILHQFRGLPRSHDDREGFLDLKFRITQRHLMRAC